MVGREVVGEGAGQRTVVVVAPILAQGDVEDAHFQHVAGLGALDGHRPGQDMRPERDARLGGVDGAQLGRDVEAGRRQHLGAARHRIDRHAVAARDRQDRRAARVEIAPMAGLGRGGEMVMHANQRGEGIVAA